MFQTMRYRTRLLSLCISTVLMVVICNVTSFNIDQTESGVRYLPENRGNRYWNISKKGNREGSFYGNQIKITQDARILVSEPKWTAASSMPSSQPSRCKSCEGNSIFGSISVCEVNFKNAANCQRALRPTKGNVKRFASKLENKGGVTLACSPTDILDCGEDHFRQPGVCFQSKDNGRTWDWLKGRTSQCPVAQRKLDIIFVLDGSGSVENNFEDIKRWTQNMATKFDVQNENNQIGVVQFSSYFFWQTLDDQTFIKTEISLGQYKTNNALRRAIGKIRRRGTLTYTAHAMNKTVNDFKKGSRWLDKDTQKVMVVLTDGQASDYQRLSATAHYVRSLGIITFAVGVGSYDINELRTIATGNATSDERVLSVSTFSGLDSIVKDLSSQILKVVLEGSGNAKTASYKMEMAETGFSVESASVR